MWRGLNAGAAVLASVRRQVGGIDLCDSDTIDPRCCCLNWMFSKFASYTDQIADGGGGAVPIRLNATQYTIHGCTQAPLGKK